MSTPLNDGGPAFPRPISEIPGTRITHQSQSGMSLRDWFAGQAIAGLATAQNRDDAVAKWAYGIADAMLKAREAKQ